MIVVIPCSFLTTTLYTPCTINGIRIFVSSFAFLTGQIKNILFSVAVLFIGFILKTSLFIFSTVFSRFVLYFERKGDDLMIISAIRQIFSGASVDFTSLVAQVLSVV